MAITSFKINVPPTEVKRFEEKLAATRLPDHEIVPGAGGDYGESSTTADSSLSSLMQDI
jgi:hypothetical protein